MEENLVQTAPRCPECGQTAVRKAPIRWSPADGPAPRWSHADGDALCRPVEGGARAVAPTFGGLLEGRF